MLLGPVGPHQKAVTAALLGPTVKPVHATRPDTDQDTTGIAAMDTQTGLPLPKTHIHTHTVDRSTPLLRYTWLLRALGRNTQHAGRSQVTKSE